MMEDGDGADIIISPDHYQHQVFLKTALWKFASNNTLTDIQFICEVNHHKFMVQQQP